MYTLNVSTTDEMKKINKISTIFSINLGPQIDNLIRSSKTRSAVAMLANAMTNTNWNTFSNKHDRRNNRDCPTLRVSRIDIFDTSSFAYQLRLNMSRAN